MKRNEDSLKDLWNNIKCINICIIGIPELQGRRQWQTTPVLLLRKSHGWKSLVGYSPWGGEESDTTEATLAAVAAESSDPLCLSTERMQ